MIDLSQRKYYLFFLGIFSTIILLGIVHTGLSVYFYRFYQEPPLVYTNIPFPAEIQKNEDTVVLSVTAEYCSKGDYPVRGTFRYIDTISYDLGNEIGFFVPKGCNTSAAVPVTIPRIMPAGDYNFEGEIAVDVRWFYFKKIRTVHIESEHFYLER